MEYTTRPRAPPAARLGGQRFRNGELVLPRLDEDSAASLVTFTK